MTEASPFLTYIHALKIHHLLTESGAASPSRPIVWQSHLSLRPACLRGGQTVGKWRVDCGGGHRRDTQAARQGHSRVAGRLRDSNGRRQPWAGLRCLAQQVVKLPACALALLQYMQRSSGPRLPPQMLFSRSSNALARRPERGCTTAVVRASHVFYKDGQELLF